MTKKPTRAEIEAALVLTTILEEISMFGDTYYFDHTDIKKLETIRAALQDYEDANKLDENRYELGMGAYGAYFHDTSTGEDLKLAEVLELLNRPQTKANAAIARIVEGEKA